MSLLKKCDGRQAPLVARAAFTYADFDGTNFLPALELPRDAVIMYGFLAISTAFDAAADIKVGDADDDDSLLAATDADSTGVNALTGLNDGEPIGANTTYGLTCTDGSLSAGEGSLVIAYIRTGRTQVTEG